jgi:hypothetical protein
MPWHVDRSGQCPAAKPWAVIKDADGEVVACHTTHAMANRQMAALYASEPGYAGARARLLEAARPYLHDGLPQLREQNRDEHGRFAPGGGKPEPAGGGTTGRAVRASLGRAKTTDEVSAVLASEASAISGRTVHADLTGADVDVARDYAEGVLQGFERFPNTRVQVVTTYGPGSARPELFPESPYAYAVAGIAPAQPGGFVYHHAIGFNTKWSNQLGTRYLAAQEEEGSTVAGGHQSTAVHEYGHHVARATSMDTPGGKSALTIARTQAAAKGVTVAAHIKEQVSKYAAKNQMELAAEAFAEAMMQGTRAASDLSRAIFQEMTDRYESRNP